MSEKDTYTAEEARALFPKPSANPKGSKYLQNVGKVQSKPREPPSQPSKDNNRLETLKIPQSKKIHTEQLHAIKDGIDLLVLQAIDKVTKEHGLQTYTDESPNQIKLTTRGKSYLITIEEV